MRKLHDLDVSEVSLVPKGANKKKFMIFKSAGAAMKETVEKDELTTEGRKHIAEGNFAIPSERKYPIHDISHARNALARVSQHGTPDEKKKVQNAVYRKYPSLKPDVEKEESLSEKAKLALKASARILAPHKDEINADHLSQVANAIGIGGGPENPGMPLEGTAGIDTPLESNQRADDSLEMENAPTPKEAEHDKANIDALETAFNQFMDEEADEGSEKEMMDYLGKAFAGGKGEAMKVMKDEELSGITQKIEGDSGKDEQSASGLADDNKAEAGEDEYKASGLGKSGSDLEDDDVDEEEDDEDEMEKGYSSMSPEKIVAHKAGMAAYKKAVDGFVKKLGYRMYPDEKELMKHKDGKPVEEEKVGKVSKSDTLDLTAVPEKVRPGIEMIFKSHKELVKKNSELQTKVEELEKSAKRKEFVAKAATFKHFTGNREELVDQLMALDATNPKLRETIEKQLSGLDAEKDAISKGIFSEVGSSLPNNGSDFDAKIEAKVSEIVQKSGHKTSREQAYTDYISSPEGQRMYAEFKANRKDGI